MKFWGHIASGCDARGEVGARSTTWRFVGLGRERESGVSGFSASVVAAFLISHASFLSLRKGGLHPQFFLFNNYLNSY